MQQRLDQRVVTWEPAAVGSDGVIDLFQLEKGERLLYASHEIMRPATAAATGDATVGVTGGDVDGVITAANIDLTAAAGTIVQGLGALLLASGGMLATAATTISIAYTAGGDPKLVAPRVRFVFHVLQ